MSIFIFSATNFISLIKPMFTALYIFSKSFDNSAAISEFKYIDEFKDIQNIDFSLSKNSIEVQSGNSKLMIFKIEYLIHYISKFIPIEENDIIFSGTPKGVNKLKIGDKLEGYIENEKILNINII